MGEDVSSRNFLALLGQAQESRWRMRALSTAMTQSRRRRIQPFRGTAGRMPPLVTPATTTALIRLVRSPPSRFSLAVQLLTVGLRNTASRRLRLKRSHDKLGMFTVRPHG